MVPLEDAVTKYIFETSDLLAYRALREMQAYGGLGDARKLRGSYEGTKQYGDQGGAWSGHV